MQLKRRKSRKILINITSLIDVLFLLIIFFMVSSTFVEKPGMDLELPDSETSTLKEIKDLVLQIQADETMFLNNKPVEWYDLKGSFEQEYKQNQDAALILKADKDVRHGSVVRVMDISKQVCIKRLIIATREKK